MIFISYSRIDALLVKMIVSKLKIIYESSEVWFDEELKRNAAQNWENRLQHEISICKVFIFCMSRDSLESPNCQFELQVARQHNKDILPVIVRPKTVIPIEFAKIQYIDMSEGTESGDAMAHLFASLRRLLEIPRNVASTNQFHSNHTPSDLALDDRSTFIANTDNTPLRVIAGPGTGKTYSLMRRVERLLGQHVDPKRILFVTFTRTAAASIKEDLAKSSVLNATSIVARTLHSLCLQILQSSGYLSQQERTNRLLLEFEKTFLLTDIGTDSRFKGYKDAKERLKTFEAGWAKENDDEPGQIKDESDQVYLHLLMGWLMFHKAMLIEEIIPHTLKYLRANPLAPELKLFDHVLIDEYQDLNKAEQAIVDLFGGRSALVVVGDIDQSIYEILRNAYPFGILELHKRFRQVEVNEVDIEVCQRCPANIIDVANSLIKENQVRRKEYFIKPSDPSSIGKISVVQWDDVEQECIGIGNFIQHRLERGEVIPDDVLVLCPRKVYGAFLKEYLNKAGIGVHFTFREQLFDGNPKQDEYFVEEAFTLLRLAADKYDRVALRCWLGFGDSNLLSSEYKSLQSYCYAQNMHPIDYLGEMLNNGLLIPYDDHLASRYQLLQSHLKSLEELTDYQKFMRLFPRILDWTEPVHQITKHIDENTTLSEIIEIIESNSVRPEVPLVAGSVRMMSLHSSKGLTAKLTIVIGCINGMIPKLPDSEMSLKDRQRLLEEQRRLFYVAITRTQSELVLSSCLSMPYELAKKSGVQILNRAKGSKNSQPRTQASSFLGELGSACPPAISGENWKY